MDQSFSERAAMAYQHLVRKDVKESPIFGVTPASSSVL